MPTMLVRRLISAFSRSSGFVDQIFVHCVIGKVRWFIRSQCYSHLLTNAYPPFRLAPD